MMDTAAGKCEHCGKDHTRMTGGRGAGRRAWARFCSRTCSRHSWRRRYRRDFGINYDTEYSRDRREGETCKTTGSSSPVR